MLWKHYVFRRGSDVHEMWHDLFQGRAVKLLYITGRGFDIRAQTILEQFAEAFGNSDAVVTDAKMLLLQLPGYHLSEELEEQTERNEVRLREIFGSLTNATTVGVAPISGEDDVSPSNALQLSVAAVLDHVSDQTDVVLDISSLPRVIFLAILTGLLNKLIPDKMCDHPLMKSRINLQIVVAEDPMLDAHIRSEDPSSDLLTIAGYSSALHEEAVQDWPLVWFPILGENRLGQLQKVASEIPKSAEICPVLPHPSRDPRRADRLIIEYKEPLFDIRRTPTGNILYAHEFNPFEAYRQLLRAMERYRDSLRIMGGSRLVVTPLGSKLVSVAAGLACFEIRPSEASANYRVGMPYAEATRYLAEIDRWRISNSELCVLLLTGDAYATQ